MTELQFDADIHGTADSVFDAITDLRGYDRWLPTSATFPGTTEISTDPIATGTTYVESGPQGVRRGTVTEFDRPTTVAFHQPMTMKPKLLGVIDILVRYTLTPAAGAVRLSRTVTLSFGWPLKLMKPLVLRQFRQESERTMRALKAFVEG